MEETSNRPTALLVMGVAGAGKSTLGRAVAEALGWTFLEGDDLHPPANIAKMRAGTPLTDSDRAPWLAAIGARVDSWTSHGRSGVVACSALKRAYRDGLRAGRPGLRIVYLTIGESAALARVAARRGHAFPASLVRSQFATLEPPAPDEHAIEIPAEESIAAQVSEILARIRG